MQKCRYSRTPARTSPDPIVLYPDNHVTQTGLKCAQGFLPLFQRSRQADGTDVSSYGAVCDGVDG
jgi:hypothetical protein